MTEELNWARMAARRRPARPVPAGGETVIAEDTSSNRKKKEEVLNQARAVLRQSQQFRPVSIHDKKNNNLSNKLAFQQPVQEDFWTPSGLVVDSTSLHQQRFNPLSEVVKQSKGKLEQEDDFGLPFRDSVQRDSIMMARRSSKSGASQPSSSSTTISMNTAELNVSSDSDTTPSDSDSDQGGSVVSVKKRKHRKNVKIIEPVTMKLTPLTPAPTANLNSQSEELGGNKKVEIAPVNLYRHHEDSESEPVSAAPSGKLPIVSSELIAPPTFAAVETDELGFSRAHVKKSEGDPHWFEKALLVRGESISGAAYKSFKQVQSPHISFPQTRDEKKRKPIFTNLTDPEYTADWISDGELGENDEEIEQITEIPESEFVDQDFTSHGGGGGGIEDEARENNTNVEDDIVMSLANDVDTSSLIKTATELEASGVLEEIAETLHSVLEISEKPESQPNDFRLSKDGEASSPEEGYDDEFLEEEFEPLKSIFNDIFTNPDETEKKAEKMDEEVHTTSQTKSKSLSHSKSHNSHHRRESSTIGNIWVQYDGDDYDDTFIQGSSTTSTANKSTYTSKKVSSSKTVGTLSKDGDSKSTLSGTITGKTNKSGGSNTAVRSRRKSENIEPVKASSHSKSGLKSSNSGLNEKTNKTEKKVKTSSKSLVGAQPSKKESSVGEREPHPSSRYQKNIKSILEKEVYQKELKRRRSQRLRDERSQERRKATAKESAEKNKGTSWKDPAYTEILLPELFKYKSVSGLQAAKAKRTTGVASPLPPSMNFGAPFFNFDGTLSSDQFASAGSLAAAKVESLDIPDLVREVLASNERMYRMTVQAGKEMAKVYKNKVRAKTATSRHK